MAPLTRISTAAVVILAVCGVCDSFPIGHHSGRAPGLYTPSNAFHSPRRLSSVYSLQLDSKVTDEIHFLEDDGDFDLDHAEVSAKISEFRRQLATLAKTSYRDPTATKKAESILDKWFQLFVEADEDAIPTVEAYNWVLETYAFSKESDGAQKAQDMLTRMEDDENSLVAPNQETYTLVMDAYAMRKNPDEVQKLLDRMKGRAKVTDDDAIFPDINAYNKLIKAYGIAGETSMAMELFNDLLENEDMPPNYKTWLQAMKSLWHHPDAPAQIEALLDEMMTEYESGNKEFYPKTDAYNQLIRAFSRSRGGFAKAEAILYDLLREYNEGNINRKPNASSFQFVLEGLRSRRDGGAAAKAEQLIQLQESLYAASDHDEDLQLTERQLNLALSINARSTDPDRPRRAKRIFEKVKARYGNSMSTAPYYYSLQACAMPSDDPEKNLKHFQFAVSLLNELKESNSAEPDSGCYGMFLRSCQCLMPATRKRDAVIESAFNRCCNDGLVNKFVLEELEAAASDELQLQLLGGFLADGIRLPEEWSCCVK